MTLYCPSCGSTNIEQRTRTKPPYLYWYCNNCGARGFEPGYQPDAAPINPPTEELTAESKRSDD